MSCSCMTLWYNLISSNQCKIIPDCLITFSPNSTDYTSPIINSETSLSSTSQTYSETSTFHLHRIITKKTTHSLTMQLLHQYLQ